MDLHGIGPYRIVESLGQGAMGVVYRARHATSERAVALKTVRVPSPRLLDSIRREIHALTRIRHPGVVRILDNGVHEGRPWYAMDLLEGESLRHFGQRIWSRYRQPTTPVGVTEGLSETDALSVGIADLQAISSRAGSQTDGSLPAAGGELVTVVKIVRRICAALAYLHGEGLINCDLKPENILLVRGEPVIIDFGLTAHHPGGSSREELEAIPGMAGTVPYMSPEQIRGEFVDARSDLYSVGCLLYELVVGAPPFAGSPRSIVTQHLSSEPPPPSSAVTGVPEQLEQLILRLLAKDVRDRSGHADEVAVELAEIGADARRLSDHPPARPYLYRPRFVGRDVIVRELTQLRDRAAAGSGSLVMLGGESGSGKTRVAMELTRVAPASFMRVVTSESQGFSSSQGAATVGTAPLHSMRSLLRAVADRCQEGGPDAAERFLGHRRSVLALYEPLLAQIPAREPLAPVVPLSVEASRHRLFTYLAETLAILAEDQPLLWVLDDIGWADELSLAFLASLGKDFLEATPVLIFCTYRSEEAPEAVTALARKDHAFHVMLPRLEQQAVQSIVADMLALRDVPNRFVEFVARQAEGNPFFVAEYLRTAVSERLLFRDQQHSWQFFREGEEAQTEYESFALPRSLRAHIEHRLRQLSPAARQAALAAAVLGREADIELVGGVAALSETAVVEAVDELLRRQILEPKGPSRLRFVHDKLREVAYSDASPERLCELHARAGQLLEERLRDGADVEQPWATLGHHFAVAKRFEPAARYLKLAADHARATHANGEAISLYRDAIEQINQMRLLLTAETGKTNETLLELHEGLADVLSLMGQRDEARARYTDALSFAPETAPETSARLHRKCGKTWETQHQHQQALASYEAARRCFDRHPSELSERERAEWLEVHIGELWANYWLNNLEQMDVLSAKIAPTLEDRVSSLQRAGFFETQTARNLRRDRYVIREETLRYAELALEASVGSGDEGRIIATRFGLGFVLVFHRQPLAAVEQLRAALRSAERAGDLAQQVRCLAYLAVAFRMQGLDDDCEALTERCRTVATSARIREYVAVARSNEAWLALRKGDAITAQRLAEEALDVWRSSAFAFPFQWLALVPLLRVALASGDVARAASHADALLAPTQHHLPGLAADLLARGAQSAKSEIGMQAARAALEQAIGCLNDSDYH
jgi:serine/threonine protein kinase/tetratricopeptide (TPR) repeat protein